MSNLPDVIARSETIPAMALANADRFMDAEAVVDAGMRLTFAELGAAFRRSAAAMIAAGVERGDRVAVWAPNSAAWVVAAVGLQAAGAALVPINTRFKGGEAADVLRRSRARLLVTVTDFLGIDPVRMLAETGVELPHLGQIVVASGRAPTGCTSWSAFLEAGAQVSDDDVERRVASLGPDDVSDIMFTSGTTGAPKGVVMRHGQTLRQFGDWCDWAGLQAGDRYLVVNPFFHMFGYKAGWLACLLRGVTLIPVPVFDVEVVLDLVERERVTVFPAAPTVYQSILDHPSLPSRDVSSLRVCTTGAADIPVELIRRMHAELPFEAILTGYGLTEAGTCTGSRRGDSVEAIATTAGRPMPDIEVRVVAPDGSPAPTGEPGEVVVRGFSVMAGYLDDPEATAAAVDGDGWLHTGDLGAIDDDGALRIVGRLKDMFIVGGFNAYPAEIENLLLGHPAVVQAAVIGIPDPRLGEVGMAYCVLRAGASLSDTELIAWCREVMANFKVPRRVAFLDALPMSATGKVLKEELRERAAR